MEIKSDTGFAFKNPTAQVFWDVQYSEYVVPPRLKGKERLRGIALSALKFLCAIVCWIAVFSILILLGALGITALIHAIGVSLPLILAIGYAGAQWIWLSGMLANFIWTLIYE